MAFNVGTGLNILKKLYKPRPTKDGDKPRMKFVNENVKMFGSVDYIEQPLTGLEEYEMDLRKAAKILENKYFDVKVPRLYLLEADDTLGTYSVPINVSGLPKRIHDFPYKVDGIDNPANEVVKVKLSALRIVSMFLVGNRNIKISPKEAVADFYKTLRDFCVVYDQIGSSYNTIVIGSEFLDAIKSLLDYIGNNYYSILAHDVELMKAKELAAKKRSRSLLDRFDAHNQAMGTHRVFKFEPIGGEQSRINEEIKRLKLDEICYLN